MSVNHCTYTDCKPGADKPLGRMSTCDHLGDPSHCTYGKRRDDERNLCYWWRADLKICYNWKAQSARDKYLKEKERHESEIEELRQAEKSETSMGV